jgi:hypothetical protein
VVISDTSCALTVLTFPSPAILPVQVRVLGDPGLPAVHVGVPTKCGLAASAAVMNEEDVANASAATIAYVITVFVFCIVRSSIAQQNL